MWIWIIWSSLFHSTLASYLLSRHSSKVLVLIYKAPTVYGFVPSSFMCYHLSSLAKLNSWLHHLCINSLWKAQTETLLVAALQLWNLIPLGNLCCGLECKPCRTQWLLHPRVQTCSVVGFHWLERQVQQGPTTVESQKKWLWTQKDSIKFVQTSSLLSHVNNSFLQYQVLVQWPTGTQGCILQGPPDVCNVLKKDVCIKNLSWCSGTVAQ